MGSAESYTGEEFAWLEAEWAYHLHGRSAFMSREDFLQAQAWAGEGVPAEAVVDAMEAYFARREKRGRGRGFVALSHLARDVAKAMQLRRALDRAGVEPAGDAAAGWAAVREPLRSDARAGALFAAWKRLQASAPLPDSPGFLDHFDAERKAYKDLVAAAEARLGEAAGPLRAALEARLAEAKMEPGSLVWRRAWDHHWCRSVCEAWGIPG